MTVNRRGKSKYSMSHSDIFWEHMFYWLKEKYYFGTYKILLGKHWELKQSCIAKNKVGG